MKIIAIDTETELFYAGNMIPKLACYVVDLDGDTRIYSYKDDAGLVSAMDMAFDEPDTFICAHNSRFDFSVFMRAFPQHAEAIWGLHEKGKVICSMLNTQLHHIKNYGDTKGDYSLAGLAKRYFNEVLDKDTYRLSYDSLRDVPFDQWPKGALDYVALDAAYSRKIIEKNGVQVDAPEQTAYYLALAIISQNGLCVDQTEVPALRARIQKEMDDRSPTLKAAGIIRPTGSRDMGLLASLVEKDLGDKTPKTKTGKVSCDAETLELCSDPLLSVYREYMGYDKLMSTYVPLLESAKDRPIQCNFGLAKTGRVTSSKPNMQNMPRKGGVRECFIPRRGRLFASCDYSGMELATLAQACVDLLGFSDLAKAINEGKDPHIMVACNILGITYAEFSKKIPEHKEARQLAKAANFGFAGGLGVDTFTSYAKGAYGLDISAQRAKDLKNNWLATWYEMRDYFRYCSYLVNDVGSLEHIRSKRVKGNIGFCDTANAFFQGLGADGSKWASFCLVRDCFDPDNILYKNQVRIVNSIHDEVLAEVPEDLEKARECVKHICDVMVSCMMQYTPNVTAKVEPTLMRRWYKEAEAVYDEKGRLLVWEK